MLYALEVTIHLILNESARPVSLCLFTGFARFGFETRTNKTFDYSSVPGPVQGSNLSSSSSLRNANPIDKRIGSFFSPDLIRSHLSDTPWACAEFPFRL